MNRTAGAMARASSSGGLITECESGGVWYTRDHVHFKGARILLSGRHSVLLLLPQFLVYYFPFCARKHA